MSESNVSRPRDIAEQDGGITREYMSVREAAQYLGISPHTLYKLVERSEVPAGKIGGSWRFSKARLDQFINSGSLKRKPDVLIVSPDEADNERVSGMIVKRARQVSCVSSLADAASAITERRPDIVLLSGAFPVAGSTAFVTALRALPNAPRLALMTGPRESALLTHILDSGPVFAMRRPVEREDVIALLTLITE